MDVLNEGKEKIHVDTLFDVLDTYCRVPERPTSALMRMPVSGIYKIRASVMFFLHVVNRAS